MNPHFIFNSLNSIQKYIWENKEEDAAEYLAKFAKLMRGILEHSRKESISLHEEVTILNLYLELEHRRANGIFDYKVEINKNVDSHNWLVPPLILQPFVENAIWHGLSKKQSHGNLEIIIETDDNFLTCIIQDDGVGRNYGSKNSSLDKKSLGLTITEQRLQRLIEVTQQHASLEIIDSTDQKGAPCGTKILVKLPIIKSKI
jgi:LytS/YehU family sensor histidine kinase